MAIGNARLSAMICEDDYDIWSAVAAIVAAVSGFQLTGPVTSAVEGLAMASRLRPDVIVIDLALAGDLGVGVVRAFRGVAPGCAVVAVVPPEFSGLRRAALESGATALLELSDVRPLRQSLQEIRALAHANRPCDCCRVTVNATSTAIAFDAEGSRVGSWNRGSSKAADLNQ